MKVKGLADDEELKEKGKSGYCGYPSKGHMVLDADKNCNLSRPKQDGWSEPILEAV
jgi:hypothetical protein